MTVKILLSLHIFTGILLIITILLHQTNTNELTGIGQNNIYSMGHNKNLSNTNFVSKIIIILAMLFLLNAIALGNIFYNKTKYTKNQNPQNSKYLNIK